MQVGKKSTLNIDKIERKGPDEYFKAVLKWLIPFPLGTVIHPVLCYRHIIRTLTHNHIELEEI